MDERIDHLLRILKVQKVRHLGDKWTCTCPFAQWTHSGGRDENPSFAFWKTRNGVIRYHCLACGERGRELRLPWRMMEFSGHASTELSTVCYNPFVLEKQPEEFVYRIGGPLAGRALERRELPWTPSEGAPVAYSGNAVLWEGMNPQGSVPPEEFLSEDTIQKFEHAPIPDYAAERGISEAMYRAWRLGNDIVQRRLIFPSFDRDGRLVGYTGRLYWNRNFCFRCGELISEYPEYPQRCGSCDQMLVKYKHTKGPWRRTNLYGIHRYQEGKPIVVVEGTTGVLRLSSLGIANAMAVFGASVHARQMQLIAELKPPWVVVVGDGDKAGRRMNESVQAAMNGFGIRVRVVELPDGYDPGEMKESEEWFQQLKYAVEQ